MYDEIEAMRYSRPRRRAYGRRYYPYYYGYYRPNCYPRCNYYNPYYYPRPYYNPYPRRRRPGRLYGMEVGTWDPDMYTGGDMDLYDGREY